MALHSGILLLWRGCRWLAVWAAFVLQVSLAAAGPEQAWRDLHLVSFKEGGVTVHHERDFDGQVEKLRNVVAELFEGPSDRQEKLQWIADHRDQVIDDLNEMFRHTPSSSQRDWQRQLVMNLIAQSPVLLGGQDRPLALYLVRQETIKAFLRSGKDLPGFSYDPIEDSVTYLDEISAAPSNQSPVHLALPVAALADAESELRRVAGWRERLGISPALLFHELAEGTMLIQLLKPQDPYFRWFTEGFANVLAAELSRKYFGENAVGGMVSLDQTNPYRDLQEQVLLGFWLPVELEIPIPFEDEEMLRLARYAHATREAQRLVDRHGVGVVGEILQEVVRLSDSPERLVEAVSKVTGEVMADRLARYQLFETREEGVAYYADVFNAAMARGAGEEALRSVLRLNELHGGMDHAYWAMSVHWLHRLGQAQAGDRVMEQRSAFLREKCPASEVLAWKRVFVSLAVQMDQLAVAHEMAEHVLLERPEDIPALLIRLHRLARTGQLELAEITAKQILDLAPHADHRAHRVAQDAMLRIEAIRVRREAD